MAGNLETPYLIRDLAEGTCYCPLMAGPAGVVAPGVPHHVTQRGNYRRQTFFADDDYVAYRELMAELCCRCGVEVWAYCLMLNHVHLIVVPASEDGLRRAVGEAYRRYSRFTNFREGWRGHLFQGRFASHPVDERYLLAAADTWNSIRSGRLWSSHPAPIFGAARLLT